MTTGERIAQKRHEKGWTQHDLAKKLGLNSKSVKDWESGVSLPSAKTIVKLCHLLNVSSDYLLCLDSRETLYLDDLSSGDRARIKAYFKPLKTFTFLPPKAADR